VGNTPLGGGCTTGFDRDRSYTRNCCRGAHGAAIVFDTTTSPVGHRPRARLPLAVPLPVTVLQFLPLPSSSSPHPGPAPGPLLRLLFHACQERAMFSCRAALRLFPGFPRLASQPEHTFDRVREWHREFLELASSSTSMVSPDAVVLVGTKCDLRRPGSRHVSEAEAQVRVCVCVVLHLARGV
jgi:GTPase SAR1 family protein